MIRFENGKNNNEKREATAADSDDGDNKLVFVCPAKYSYKPGPCRSSLLLRYFWISVKFL